MRIASKIPRAFGFLFSMTLLLGIAYPLLVTGLAKLAFPRRANGSLVLVDGRVRGSSLLAQDFGSPRFFRARPSATDYAYIGSGASNLGPTSESLAKAAGERKAAWESSFGSRAPEEMLYSSGSGLDPEVGVETALAQLGAVAKARGLDPSAERELAGVVRDLAAVSAGPLGPRRVNVTVLNVLMETDPRFAAQGR